MMLRMAILVTSAILVGCSTVPPRGVTNIPAREPVTFDTVPFRWEDYSNRVWISVSGVGVENPNAKTNILKKVNFKYSPNTGKSPAESIAVVSFNMFSGDTAERLLLKVLFDMEGNWLSSSNVVLDGKAFHIYRIKTHSNATNTIYFDATKYHNLF